MRIGRISKDEKTVKIELDLHCSMCGKQVPGGIKTGEQYSKTDQFEKELNQFVKKYLCGKCRDKNRVG